MLAPAGERAEGAARQDLALEGRHQKGQGAACCAKRPVHLPAAAGPHRHLSAHGRVARASTALPVGSWGTASRSEDRATADGLLLSPTCQCLDRLPQPRKSAFFMLGVASCLEQVGTRSPKEGTAPEV